MEGERGLIAGIMPAKLPAALFQILETADTETAVIPPTQVYNEGWMLRLALAAASSGIPTFPFTFEPGARWFSEALLYSAFGARFRGDPQAETPTHADGAVGHFVFTPTSKTGLALGDVASQLVVIEAKMFASLSRGTKNAPGYDQAARSVACMAETLRRHGKPIDGMRSLGFYVVAPRSQIASDVFAAEMSVDSIRRKVLARVGMFDGVRRTDLDAWVAAFLEPLLGRINLGCVAWEDVVGRVTETDPDLGAQLRAFYEKAKRFNAPPSLPAVRDTTR